MNKKRPIFEGSGAHTMKNMIPNRRRDFRPRQIRIHGRFGPKPMQLFANSKNMVYVKIRTSCPILHENRNSPQNFPMCRSLCVDSVSVIRNIYALRNLEIAFKTMFYLDLPKAAFFSVGRWDMNELGSLHSFGRWDMNKLTSEKKYTHKYDSGTER